MQHPRDVKVPAQPGDAVTTLRPHQRLASYPGNAQNPPAAQTLRVITINYPLCQRPGHCPLLSLWVTVVEATEKKWNWTGAMGGSGRGESPESTRCKTGA